VSTRSRWIFGLAATALVGGVLTVLALVGSGGAEEESLRNDRDVQRVEPPSAAAVLVGPDEDYADRPPVATPPAERVADPEPEPELVPEPEEDAESAALVELRLKVVDELGRPLPEAAVRVRGSFVDDGSPEQKLDEFGEWVLTILPEDEGDDLLLSVDASAPGRASLQRVLQSDDPLLFAGGELRLVLEPEASVDVVVKDELGKPAASAVVVLMRRRDERTGALAALRLVTDEEGRAHAEGLTEGTWSAQVVAWRDYGNAEAVAFELGAGSSERLVLEAQRWGREDHASGRVVGPGEIPLTAQECDRLYLRRTDESKRMNAVDADGAFFVKSVDAELSNWVIVREGEVVSDPFDLKEGWHDVVVTLDVR